MAVKGKSPSYLHLFPHSSAGDRGGFSKPGGKLTSITLVSPFQTINFLSKYTSSFDVGYFVVCKMYFHETTSENVGESFWMPETFFL